MALPKRRVSYIIPPPTDPVPRLLLPNQNAIRIGLVHPLLHSRSRHPRHRLGVAALALDTSTQLAARATPEGILYSAGRDGLVLSWDLGLSLRQRTPSDVPLRRGWADDAIDEEAEEADERPKSDGDILGDVTTVAARRRRPSGIRELPHEEQWELDPDASPRASSFRQCVQTHTDWVNDIVLCNYNQTLVSASSDGTVQAWTPHAPGAPDPTTVGMHSDYVRCLAACRTQNWIASGSFDRTIKLWDLTRGQASPDPLITLHPATPTLQNPPSMLSLPTPLATPSRKLVGHTDNIRAILLSEDAKYLLTGSADASIKLWSLATQRCLHTFTHHADSVWSLFSAHPALETFYAGDRAGLVSRVDVSRLTGDVGEGDSSSIRRWRIPARGSASAAASSPNLNSSYGYGSTNSARLSPSDAEDYYYERDGPRRSLAPSVLSYDDEGDGDDGETRSGIPYASLVRLTSPNDPFPVRGTGSGARDRDAEVATLYSAASVVSVPRSGPRCRTPAHPGLVRALVLNDRVHAVSVDTGGEVGVWDLVRGCCAVGLGVGVGGAGATEEWSPREALERVRERIEGEAVVGPWATVDTKAGVLAVHLNERSFESEIYAMRSVNIGKWVLRNLFLGFIREEQPRTRPSSAHHGHRPSASVSSDTSLRHRRPSLTRPDERPPRRGSTNSTVVSAPKMLPAVSPRWPRPRRRHVAAAHAADPLVCRPKEHGLGALAMPAIPGSPALLLATSNDATPMPQPNRRRGWGRSRTGVPPGGRARARIGTGTVSIQSGTAPSQPDDFSGWSGPGSAAQTPSTPTGLMGRLKSFGKLKRTADVAAPMLPTTVELPVVEEAAPEPAAKTPLQLVLAGPLTPPPSSEAPTLGLSPHILLLLEEEAAPGFTTVYRGTVGSTAADVHVLEEAMPLWLVEYLLLHRMPSTPPQIKISFVLLPWVTKDSSEEQLPSCLIPHCEPFLRVRKLTLHVQEKLEKIDPPPPDAPRPRAEDLYEILCNDVVLPLDMSIAAVRQYVWRQTTELTMCYRRNRDMSAYRGSLHLNSRGR
ncbi:hypothetical protein B0H13DRAFT_2234296 [Mycena leptocephala]|nr:hypothetical protein B0H13DRAFT_2234296 [Mycena leptocephala]